MFRSLFRRPRTVRVPVENANIAFQRVNVIQQPKQFKSRPAITQFMFTGVIVFLTIQGMKYLDPFGQYQNRDSLPDQDDKTGGNDIGSEKGSRYGKHWDAQHAQHAQQVQGNTVEPSAASGVGSHDLFRLTVPIWFRKGPTYPYGPTDPVFKEYEKLQSDKKRINDLKKLIIDSVFKSLKSSGMNMRELQLIGFNGKVLGQLDIVPQLGAPPIYQVPCVWISTNSLPEYGWRSLPPDTGARVERVFRPLALLQAASIASQVFVYTVYAITKAKVNETLNIGKGLPSTRSQILIPQMPPPSEAEKAAKATDTGVTKSQLPILPFLPDLSNSQGTRQIHQDVVSAMPYSLAITQAAAAFNHAKAHKQRAAASSNVRGACQIRGVLRFMGERGQFWMEIAVWYLPSENLFLGTVQVKQRYIIPDYPAIGKEYEEVIKRNKGEVARRKLLKEQASSPNSSDSSSSSKSPDEDSRDESSSKKDGSEE